MFSKLSIPIVLSLLLSNFANANDYGVVGYPWSSSFSYSSAEHYGSKTSLRYEQGIELGKRKVAWRLVPYVAVDYQSSNREQQYWNNTTTPKSGLRLRRVFTSKTIQWGEATLGVERSKHNYHSDSAPEDEIQTEMFIRVSISGNWDKQ